MERPTSALHLTRVTLHVQPLSAEPHTKEVGRGEVYYHHRVRSARSDDGRRGVTPRTSDSGAAHARVRYPHDSSLPRSPAPPGTDPVLLRSRPMRLRVTSGAHGAPHPLRHHRAGADSSPAWRSH